MASLFKTREPRGFNYQPRHYNPEEEEMKQRVAESMAKAKGEEAPHKPLERGFLRNQTTTLQTNKSQKRLRLIMIVGGVIMIACIVIFSIYLINAMYPQK